MKKKLLFLLLKFGLVYLSWYLIFHFLSDTPIWYKINNAVRTEVIFFSKYILIFLGKILNFTVQSVTTSNYAGTTHDTLVFYRDGVIYQNYGTLFVAFSCLAVDLMYFFTGFILIFFGSWKKKLWFIPLGIFIINAINIIRLVGLGLTVIYFPKYLDFNHHFLFTLITYLIILSLWVLWIVKYASDDIIKFFRKIKQPAEPEN